MIAISRMKDEGLVIDQNIIITVVEISEDEVQLCVEGPPDLEITTSTLERIAAAAE